MKKSEYARRIAQGQFGHVTLFDHFKSVCHVAFSLRILHYIIGLKLKLAIH
jgi:hypothetical protein